MNLFRFTVNNFGIYEVVESACPKDDLRRESKPDGSWLPKVGTKFPGAISFWTEFGLKKYQDSGLKDWHYSVMSEQICVTERQRDAIEILYEDQYQVIGHLIKQ